MFKKATLKYNGFTLQSPSAELEEADKNENDPLTLTYAKDNPATSSDFYVRITDFTIDDVKLLNPSEKKQGSHGSVFGASTEVERIIKIEGELIAFGYEGKKSGWEIINRIFRADDTPSILKRGIFKLEFEDYAGENWFCYAQVDSNYTRFDHDPNHKFITPFIVYLKSEDVRIYSDVLYTKTLIEGNIGGFDIGAGASGGVGTLFPDGVSAGGEIEEAGNAASPTKITIQRNDGVVDYGSEWLAVNPTIWNLANDKYFRVTKNMGLKDVITIDAMLGEVRVNGVLSNGLKVLGSSYIYILGTGTNLVLTDLTHISRYGQKIKALVEYRKVIK